MEFKDLSNKFRERIRKTLFINILYFMNQSGLNRVQA